ncbi:MAG: molybdopterin-dependent oxidoreductase [Armatimonadetes bacterium]|nr:molybdopterin-dependent oxidoreductase [Armatimonadota bacterium]MDW8153348.1 molybdopterin-dependent oxidoreductase [Armatimonadota bacterium]
MRRLLWGGLWGWLAFGALMLGPLPVGLSLWLRPLSEVRPPVEALGERVFRALSPEAFALLVNFLEDVGRRYLGVSHLAKHLALLGANTLVFLLSAWGAWIFDRRPARRTTFWGRWLVTALLTWLAWAVVLLPAAGGGWFGAALGPLPNAAALLAAGSLLYGAALALPRGQDRPARSGGLTRREVLGRGARLVLVVLWGSTLAAWGERAFAWARSVFDRIRGLPPEITPNHAFYTVSKNFFDPQVDPRRWRLEITGLVETPLRLSLEDLKRLPSFSRPHTFACISNPVGGDLIGNAVWRGVRFRDLLARARPKPRARKVVFRCADGYHTALPLSDLLDPDAFLAYEMNGEVLPNPHGFPLRAVIPGLYGMKNPKWITRIELTDEDHLGYWESQGWSDEAVVKTTSKFTTPRDGAVVPAGQVWVGGVAYAGDRGIRAVEVSFDGGRTWQGAALKPPLGRHTWVLWALRWDARPGRYTLAVRAWDGRGFPQDPTPRPPLPEGASGYHIIRVTVR